ncbi:MAG TPA: hypothetical protein VH677_02255 [Nitrososphaera sp.]
MFGKAKCRLCGDSVRFALKHLTEKHPELVQGEMDREKMRKLVDKYFS